MLSSLVLAFMAGVLSILSPCVLPLVPIVLASSLSAHRYGSVALATGLSLSFTAIGLFLATVGFSIGLSSEDFRSPTAAFMLLVGLLLLSPFLQNRFVNFLEPLNRYFQNQSSAFMPSGLWGQFGLGILLGAVWSPCVGPTLGAASVLASQKKELFDVFVTMAIFGVGAALPLLVIGKMTQSRFQKSRYALLSTSAVGKKLMGALFALLGILILSGSDKLIENYLVEISPDWLVRLTTQF
ncbi:MAG: cytochrome c biogenesis protein CcdA [Methylocystaceae bacterium]|nr:cytochrome c biogenesis protein CcdA [Methylocystaceae bacterium]